MDAKSTSHRVLKGACKTRAELVWFWFVFLGERCFQRQPIRHFTNPYAFTLPLQGYVPRPFILILLSHSLRGIRSRSSQESVFRSANTTNWATGEGLKSRVALAMSCVVHKKQCPNKHHKKENQKSVDWKTSASLHIRTALPWNPFALAMVFWRATATGSVLGAMVYWSKKMPSKKTSPNTTTLKFGVTLSTSAQITKKKPMM